MVITARIPIHSVLFLVLVFFNVSGLLILVWFFSYNCYLYIKDYFIILNNLNYYLFKMVNFELKII